MKQNSAFTAFYAGALGHVRGHWRGAQSLAWSFWIDLALLRAILFSLYAFAQPFLSWILGGPAPAAVAVVLLADFAICTWQVVGVVRACDRYQQSYGSVTTVWFAYIGILVALIFTLVGAFTLLQNTFNQSGESLVRRDWDQERASKYDLTLSDDGTSLILNGSFELGLTKRLGALLQQHPGVKRIALASPGGNIYASRGVARLIQKHGLESAVHETCSSACTIAFIAGAIRSLGPQGRLGFHQYGIEADYQVPFVDLSDEQATDRALFRSQGISDDFLDRIFEAAPEDIWFPSAEELLAAGVVHRVDTTVR